MKKLIRFLKRLPQFIEIAWYVSNEGEYFLTLVGGNRKELNKDLRKLHEKFYKDVDKLEEKHDKKA